MMLQSEKQHPSQKHLPHQRQWCYNQRNNTHHRNTFLIDGNDATIRETTCIIEISSATTAMMLQSEKQHASQKHLLIDGNDATIRKTTGIIEISSASTAMMLQSEKQHASQKHLPHQRQWCYNQRNNTHHRNIFHIDGNDATIRETTRITGTSFTSMAMMLQSEK